ncbi:MAG: hypothetical protein EZS28_045686, partial [Streblomastix strix]
MTEGALAKIELLSQPAELAKDLDKFRLHHSTLRGIC